MPYNFGLKKSEVHFAHGSPQTQKLVMLFLGVEVAGKFVGREQVQGKEAEYELFTLPN